MRISARLGAVALVAAGLELMTAPAWLPDQVREGAADSFRTAGPVLVTAGFFAAFTITHALRWLALPAALWLIAAPVVVPHAAAALVNTLAVGVATTALLVLPIWDPAAVTRYGGGWRALWRSGEFDVSDNVSDTTGPSRQ